MIRLFIGVIGIASMLKSIESSERLPIVYVYTLSNETCSHKFPTYIETTLEQALLTQQDCDIVMASNYVECPAIGHAMDRVSGLIQIDTKVIKSDRTVAFEDLSISMFASTHNGALWMTSAQRFFSMEDVMKHKGYTEMLHVEADNLLFGKLTDILPGLRTGYPSLTATPMTARLSFVTASVLWIPTLASLQTFNDFLLNLGKNRNGEWKEYILWLRGFACCVKGGVDPDKDGNGVKPFAINEMSMLAYYSLRSPSNFSFFPVLPAYNYITNRYTGNMSSYAVGGHCVGPATGQGIWDPGSWGQHLGGTASRNGRDIGFRDMSHVVGQAIALNQCRTSMLCSNVSQPFQGTTSPLRYLELNGSTSFTFIQGPQQSYCYTAPYVRCADSKSWTALWNLHVHSKWTGKNRSVRCDCP